MLVNTVHDRRDTKGSASLVLSMALGKRDTGKVPQPIRDRRRTSDGKSPLERMAWRQFATRLYSAHVNPSGCSSAWLERYVRDVEVAGSNPVIPTIPQSEPFGENVERLSLFGD